MSEKQNIIKKYRLARGYTQKQLGEKCGINEANIRKYETGRQNAKYETLEKIADALEIPVTELLTEKQRKKIVIDTRKMVDAINKTYGSKISSDFIEHCTDMIQARQAKFDLNHPYNRAIQKLKNNEELDSEEKQALENYIQSGTLQHAFDSFGDSVKKLIEQLLQNYEELNELGKRKADEHIERAVQQVDEFVESLVKIPEYQKKED